MRGTIKCEEERIATNQGPETGKVIPHKARKCFPSV